MSNTRDPRYDILFEPIKIGPVTAKNRFYQVPHCSGMGWQRPNTLAAMRGTKAEGGWGVVNTEYCSIHPTSDDAAYPYARLWDKEDVKAHALMTEQVHKHNALAGVELWLGGNFIGNLDSRTPPLGLTSRPLTAPSVYHPQQSRRIEKSDIRDILRWQKEATVRAIEAGFDLVYVYTTHGYLLSEFLDSTMNHRTDEYGGSLENRVRIIRELIEVTLEAAQGKCAVATRFSADIQDEETYEAFAMLADLPDLWDLVVHDYDIEMGVSRFVKESALEVSVARAKAMTTKPVVAVGRFTSPDTMARVIKNGTQDMIGAARPSIADPFLPNKIRDGRIEDIRECIGCNICYAHNSLSVPLRCTQNPTMGEEWRRGWHPEKVTVLKKPECVLIVGAGPSGLEAGRVLGERGAEVMITDASREVGGRVTREAKLPGLSEWARVSDWRIGQIEKLSNVEIYRESKMGVDDIAEIDVSHVIVATGSTWTTDGIGRARNLPISINSGSYIIGIEQILAGEETPSGHAVIYDDDHYYMGSVIALELIKRGNRVTLITPAGRASQWGTFTEEIYASNALLINSGAEIITNQILEAVGGQTVTTSCYFSGKESKFEADWVVPVTQRKPHDSLYQDLVSNVSATKKIIRIGDCEAPGLIASAVYSGYKAAIDIDKVEDTLLRNYPL